MSSDTDIPKIGAATRFALPYGGRKRQYLLYVPISYFAIDAMPLAVVLHGKGGDGERMESRTGFSEVAEEFGFFVAYPNAYEGDWDRSGDVGFIQAMVEEIGRRVLVDRSRLYLVGFSQGAGLTHQIVADWGEAVAGFAALSHTLPKRHAQMLADAAPVPAIFMHGTSDPISPYLGGPTSLSARETAEFWALKNGDVVAERTPLPLKLDNGRIHQGLLHTWRRGGLMSSWPVTRFYSLEGGGHGFPGSNPDTFTSRSGPTVVEIAGVSNNPAARLIYDHLKTFTKQS